MTELVQLLEQHRYSSSPWTCKCGAALENSNLNKHVAQMICRTYTLTKVAR